MARPAFFILGGWIFLCALMMFAVWSFPPQTGELPDTDDYMRMTRVFDMLDGRDLTSYAAPRLGVDGSGEIGWSRLIDWPLAAVQGALETFLARLPAAMVTATIMPALALLAFLAAGWWYARPLIKGRSALFVMLAMFFLWGVFRQFMPGRVDHHMWQAVLGVLAYGAILRIFFTPEKLCWPVLAGLCLGTGLAVGADIIPWLTFGAALGGFFWLCDGRRYEKPGLIFGASVFGTALAWHLLLHEPGRLFLPVCDYLSVAWIALALALGGFWGAVYALPARFKDALPKRLAAGVIVALPLLGAVFALFPGCFLDPYQIENPLVREIWLDSVREADSLLEFYGRSNLAGMFFALPPLLAFAASLWAMAAEKQSRTLWAGLMLVLLCGTGLLFYQVRTVDFVQGVAIAPLAWLLVATFTQAGALARRFRLTRRQRLAGASFVFMAGLLFLVFASVTKQEELPRAATQEDVKQCRTKEAAEFLATIPGPLTIAAYIDIGSELLFRTSHKVLAAPYHRNEDGIIAAYGIVTAPDAEAARALMARSGADIIMLCEGGAELWMKDAPFAHALLQGEIPDWLKPLGGGRPGNYLILQKGKE